jgi:hypothetical protein
VKLAQPDGIACQLAYCSALVGYRAFLEKLLVTHIAKKFPAPVIDEGLLPNSLK